MKNQENTSISRSQTEQWKLKYFHLNFYQEDSVTTLIFSEDDVWKFKIDFLTLSSKGDFPDP